MATALDKFFEHYYRRRPVNATFTGVHAYDAVLPDWSDAGLKALDAEMVALVKDLSTPARSSPSERDDAVALDAELAGDFLEIQRTENSGTHGVRGNPSLWIGEAVFSVISLMIRDFAPCRERMASTTARLAAVPDFLAEARCTMRDADVPIAWSTKAARECEGARILFSGGIERWIAAATDAPTMAVRLRDAAARAEAAVRDFASWLVSRQAAPEQAIGCGTTLFDMLLVRGHRCLRPRAELLADAKRQFEEECARRDDFAARMVGSWREAQESIAADHPAPADYLSTFKHLWASARESAVSHDVVTWPDWPINYVPYPEWTREAAPYLYYLHYRSPAPFDPQTVHDYVVPALPTGSEEQHLRSWNNSTIKLNHVIHHGGIGHHVQNWFAYHRASSRIGQVAAVDCASRIGMFCGGTMAEGWASYVPGLMDELGFLTPLDQLAEQHNRVRFLARAIVDIELHQGSMSLDDATRFYVDRVGMTAEPARGEAVKNSMFPCTAIVYWLGTETIRSLRSALERKRGARFSLKSFHDELLEHGSIPVPLIAQLLS